MFISFDINFLQYERETEYDYEQLEESEYQDPELIQEPSQTISTFVPAPPKQKTEDKRKFSFVSG